MTWTRKRLSKRLPNQGEIASLWIGQQIIKQSSKTHQDQTKTTKAATKT